MKLRKINSVASVSLLILVFVLSGVTILFHAFPQKPDEYVELTVDYGDTLWTIAQSIAPNSDPRAVIWQIQEENQINNSTTIFPGQTIRVPSYQASL